MTAAGEMRSRTIHVSVREGRLVVDRVLLTLAIPAGYIPAVREVILTSESLGLGGFGHLLQAVDSVAEPFLDAVTVQETPDRGIRIDGGEIHAWMLAPTAIDLLVDQARRSGTSTISLTGIREPRELEVMQGLATRYGARISVDVDAHKGGITLTARNTSPPRSLEDWDPLLFRAMRDRFPVEETTWRALYTLSNRALAPDSVLSRRHAGPVILLEDGTIVGRQPADDDFDPEMLKSVGERRSG
ncbi:hypothetical protein FQ775_01555 [Nitratireductor mangrovi]|uniref:Uncharacterized protein n=1 Tax=Nitratireductor mangrovi TaxID=2599600 RepID=A0A5B8KUC1_9HYPH|nr:hypothetical protein [Nitratireductor mangrovi]QDY99160.1 hypothetical protein FQ775_01555 [Nitratireductor mangrovi]